MSELVQLKLFKDKSELPTGKCHISYSEIITFLECSWRHKLQYVDKHESDRNEFAEFGTVLHKHTEKLFFNRREYEATIETISQEARDELNKRFEEIGFNDEAEQWETALDRLLRDMPSFLDTTFPGWKPIGAEILLFERIQEQKHSRYFKGFIDRLIKMPKPLRKGSKPKPGQPIEWIYVCLDLKTTSWGWALSKKTDPLKKMQLILYKHYICEKLNIPLKQMKTGWIFAKRNPGKKDSYEYCEVSIGQKVIDNALKKVNDTINLISKSLFIKNKRSCLYCPFKDDKKLCP